MDAPSRNEGDECMFSHEPSPLDCDAVCFLWQPGEGVNQHCDFQRIVMEKYCKKILHYWENQPGGDQKLQYSFQCKNPWVHPTKADMEKAESRRGCITTSNPPPKKKKKKQQDLRVKVLKNMLQRFHSEEAASYAYKSSPVKPEPTAAVSTVVSGWARDADNDFRALILCKRGYRNSRAKERETTQRVPLFL